jgi:hypothetical protein
MLEHIDEVDTKDFAKKRENGRKRQQRFVGGVVDES